MSKDAVLLVRLGVVRAPWSIESPANSNAQLFCRACATSHAQTYALSCVRMRACACVRVCLCACARVCMCAYALSVHSHTDTKRARTHTIHTHAHAHRKTKLEEPSNTHPHERPLRAKLASLHISNQSFKSDSSWRSRGRKGAGKHLPAPAPEEPMQGVRVASICQHQRRRSTCKECRVQTTGEAAEDDDAVISA